MSKWKERKRKRESITIYFSLRRIKPIFCIEITI